MEAKEERAKEIAKDNIKSRSKMTKVTEGSCEGGGDTTFEVFRALVALLYMIGRETVGSTN
jgi:hypothetical protein